MSSALAQIKAQDVKVGPVDVNTGNAFLDIGGAIIIVLAIALGLRLINARWPAKSDRD
jgi:hypothetical protein